MTPAEKKLFIDIHKQKVAEEREAQEIANSKRKN